MGKKILQGILWLVIVFTFWLIVFEFFSPRYLVIIKTEVASNEVLEVIIYEKEKETILSPQEWEKIKEDYKFWTTKKTYVPNHSQRR